MKENIPSGKVNNAPHFIVAFPRRYPTASSIKASTMFSGSAFADMLAIRGYARESYDDVNASVYGNM